MNLLKNNYLTALDIKIIIIIFFYKINLMEYNQKKKLTGRKNILNKAKKFYTKKNIFFCFM